MVKINYQSYGNKGFQLRLRLYKDGETRFVSVNKLLKGDILPRHWNQQKQHFTASCPFSQENNQIIAQFKHKYDMAALNWEGSVYGLVASMEAEQENIGLKLTQFIQQIIADLQQRKHADGTTKGSYEGYVKLDKRLREFCEYKNIKYDKLLLSDIRPAFVDDLFAWIVNVRKGKGHVYISAMMHAVLARADKEGLVDWERFRRCKWKGKNKTSIEKYHSLSAEQCKRFLSLKPEDLRYNLLNDLYIDFCVFILYTGQSVCDAVSLKYSDIKNIGGVDHFIFKRRKISEKQAVPCAIPINPLMRSIMDKWKHKSKDGYVFPIRNNEKLNKQKTNNGDIKHFISRLNNWLKKVAPIIGVDFPLHTYVFRHTAITHYLSKNIPTIYVANMMGTSVKNCEKVYYNNLGDKDSCNKVLEAIKF